MMKWGTKLVFGGTLLGIFLIAAAGWCLACLGANAERGISSVGQFLKGLFAIDFAGPILVFLGIAYGGFLVARSGWRDLRWTRELRKKTESKLRPNEASQAIGAGAPQPER